jgi:predicted small integral membrane protein
MAAITLRLMPFATQPPAEQVTGRDKRRIAAVVAVILLVLAAVAVWSAVRPGSYGSSRDGCVTVTMPSSTGGAQIHQCGSRALNLCKRAYAGSNKVSLLTRPQCRLAGITPAHAASADAS